VLVGCPVDRYRERGGTSPRPHPEAGMPADKKVLVVGRGGREHALAWRLTRSARVAKVFVAPGNAGTARDAENVAIPANDTAKLVRFAQKEKIDLVVVGPEEPLTLGLVDALQAAGVRVFGPTKAAAQVEGSKVFAKKLMHRADVPTAEFRVFDRPDHARNWIESRNFPLVVKADGLAAGKGVVVCKDAAEALKAVERIMVREEFGREAGRQVVIEKRLQGEELSLLALVSGRTILPLPPTQDHKAAFDGDQGPNTGGMGAYCPAPLGTPELLKQAEEHVFVPTVHALKRDHTPFRGLLYAGVMQTNQGPRVLEFNARFGDPETQPLLMRLRSDLYDLLEAVADDRLGDLPELDWDPRPAVCVVLAAGGYPGKYETGRLVSGLEAADAMPDVKVFHAGTKLDGPAVLTDGGRVLGVTALGATLADARDRVYEAVARIKFHGMHYRKDIGAKALPKPAPGGKP
jgi:phosphoribosylamine--glycine ligase